MFVQQNRRHIDIHTAQVGKQNAIECMPLIMEPLSAFYGSPLVVLDFQSLYPSIMIAYNYCYSTCLGRVRKFKGTNKFGVTELDLPPGLLGKLQDHINGQSPVSITLHI
jgi:DNA polymerase zeta